MQFSGGTGWVTWLNLCLVQRIPKDLLFVKQAALEMLLPGRVCELMVSPEHEETAPSADLFSSAVFLS